MQALSELFGESPAIEALRGRIRRLLERPQASQRLPSILLQGETGTGKGLAARLIHREGPRRGGPFVDINCAAIPDGLLEAELFGFERGAFTDAHRAKPGLFQTAHRGTLFLDEVALLPPPLQAKLLTAIEEHAVRRVGSTRPEPADAWIISASNTDLRAAVRGHHFREDLYHRLAVITLSLPALRDRGQDILLLAERFLARACAEYGLPPKRLAAPAQARLLAYSWPGNIRELANVIERAALFAESPVVTADMLDPLQAEVSPPVGPLTPEPVRVVSPEEAMRQHLLASLGQTGWNISHTAARLGIARNTLYARLEKFGLRTHLPQRGRARRPETPDLSSPRPASTGRERRSAEPSSRWALPRPQLRWERREVTLLHAALRPREARGGALQTSRIVEVLIDKVHSFGGRVDELTPTGVVAVFGLDPVEDAPRRAAHASLAIHRAARRDGGDDRAPAVTIALHVASLLVGQAGTLIEIDAAAKGEQRPILDELLAVSERDQTVVSAAAARFLERRFELMAVEGIGGGRRPEAFCLTGRERRGFGLWGETTEFVGRHDELHLLRSRLALVRDGRGQLVAVVGEPGVGKSRLVWEFTRSADVHGCPVLESGAVSYGKTTPYLSVITLLKAYFGIGDRDDERALRDKITSKLLALDPRFAATLPAFLGLLDLPVEDDEWHALDPPRRRQRTQEAVRSLLLLESHQHPVVLVFEDLHWIDGETQAVLDGLADGLPGSRLLLVVSYRPEYAHAWAGKTYYTQLRIDPLPSAGAAELLDGLLGSDPRLEVLKRVLIARTGGNPFFLEESVRTLVEAQALAGERRAHRLTQPVDVIQVPPTVRAVLATRIHRLPPDEKRLLQAAAVIGNDVPFPLIQAVADLPEPDLRRSLASLQASELLYETSLLPDLQYSFRHALTHEIAYESLLDDLRRTLHARIVGATEALYPDRLAEHVERLAHHAFRGEDWERAVTFARQAGAKALARSANREATAYFEQALAALAQLAASRSTHELAVDLRFDLYKSLLPLGELRRVLDHLRTADGILGALDDQSRQGWVWQYMCHLFLLVNESRRAVDVGLRALAIADSTGDVGLQVMTSYWLACGYYSLGEHLRAVEVLGRILPTLGAQPVRQQFGIASFPAVTVRGYQSMFLAELGNFAQAVAVGDEALRLAEAVDHPYSLAIGCWQVGYCYCARGELDHARSLLERGLRVSREWDLMQASALTASTLGYAYALSGRTREGIALLEEAVERSEANGHLWLHVRRLNYQGEAYLLAGRPDAARAVAARGLALSRDRKERGLEAWARRLLGEIESCPATGDLAAATGHYFAAMALADELGMRPLVAHCQLGLGKLYRRTGHRQEAQEQLTAAMTMYREMQMRFWLDQAEAEMKEMSEMSG